MAAGCCIRFYQRLSRVKLVDSDNITETKLKRCLSTFDLTTLGIGATLGAGIYVVAGQVARDVAGPSVILSFLIAAIASVFAGLCYAEFGARIPKTGSAYVYSYVTVGEVWAFIIGWNLILEYVIGTASVARAFSTYLDSLVDMRMKAFFMEHVPLNVHTLADYADLLAFGITMLLTLIMIVGVKESSIINNIFTVINLLVVAYVVICGLFKINFDNWHVPADKVPDNMGAGGFFPYGVGGMLSGAATCFYAFVGFDVIATTGEEVNNPQRAIPVAIILSLMTCFLAYFGISAILTLMVPYFAIDKDAPIPMVFSAVGWEFARYVIAVGAIAGLSTSLLGGMFPMPRVIYAMAEDGLLFHWLAWVPERLRTPVAATLCSGTLAAFMAMLFDIQQLVEMMSIGTLLAYTLVAACVLILRYKRVPFPSSQSFGPTIDPERHSINLGNILDFGKKKEKTESVDIMSPHDERTGLVTKELERSYIQRIFNSSSDAPTYFSENTAKYSVSLIAVDLISLCLMLVWAEDQIIAVQWWAVALLVIFTLIAVVLIIVIWCQPENTESITFKVPLVPLISSLSMFVNIYLMLKLTRPTWIRFAVWMSIGCLVYFGYGIWFSKQDPLQLPDPQLRDEDEDATSDQRSPKQIDHTSLVYEGT